ncbi:two-component response regulator [Stutzerimonas stutzeri TS44]|nr:two-component response regulator [Stutzerimonas stutzeri TS44]
MLPEGALAEVQRASRASKPTSVVILDLDHFKQVNDRYGHAAEADQTLYAARRVGRNQVRLASAG